MNPDYPADFGARLIREVRKLAAAQPNNVYSKPAVEDDMTSCFYEKGTCSDGSVGCLFGQAALRLGVAWTGKDRISMKLLNKLAHSEERWCSFVQSKQDEGATWSEAVQFGDGLIGRLYADEAVTA